MAGRLLAKIVLRAAAKLDELAESERRRALESSSVYTAALELGRIAPEVHLELTVEVPPGTGDYPAWTRPRDVFRWHVVTRRAGTIVFAGATPAAGLRDAISYLGALGSSCPGALIVVDALAARMPGRIS